jgi:hypothetical protein
MSAIFDCLPEAAGLESARVGGFSRWPSCKSKMGADMLQFFGLLLWNGLQRLRAA